MSSVHEAPLPTTGPWALESRLRLGVIGDGGTADRLARVVEVVRIGPRDSAYDAIAEVDAVLVELSAFEAATGAWVHALRPGGYDRGQALARLLRVAHLHERPVLGLDDRRAGSMDAWQGVLAGALDDVAPLGPLVDGAPTWNPGVHLSEGAMVVATGAVATATVAAEPGSSGPLQRLPAPTWSERQRAAVLGHDVELDPTDPWDLHLLDELRWLGAPVGAVDVLRRPTATPGEALSALCARLDLPPPEDPVWVVVTEPSAIERRELDAALPGRWRSCRVDELRDTPPTAATIVVVAPPGGPVPATPAAVVGRALSAVPAADAVAAADDAVVAVRGGALDLAVADEDLHAHARTLALPRRLDTAGVA